MQRPTARLAATLATFLLAGCVDGPTAAPVRVAPPVPRLAAGPDYGDGRWTVTDVVPLPPATSSAFGGLLSINDRGEAVGRYDGRAIRVGSSGTDVTFLDGGTVANAINGAGDVVGVGLAGGRALLWRASGERVDLSTLAGAADGQARPNAINDRGQIAGEANGQAVLWQPGGGVTPIGTLPGETTSRATSVNADGTVVGISGGRAFVWTPATGIRPLATPGGGSQAYDINDAGVIAGAIDGRPVVWTTPDAYTLLAVGDTYVTRAVAIANDGAIVGASAGWPYFYASAGSQPRSFVAEACDAAAGAGVCRGAFFSSASAINDRGQIAGLIAQEYFDGTRQPSRVEVESPAIWTFVPTGTTPTAVALIGRASGKCLDVLGAARDAGTPLILYPCHGGGNQQFTLPEIGQTGEIRAYGGTLCLDAYSGNGQNGDPIVVWPCTGGANQQWTRVASGELQGVNGRCIDVQGRATADFTPIWLWDCLGATNQQFDARSPMVATR